MPGPSPFPGNDNLIFISGVVDTLDPTNTDGSPKLESTATVTWQIRDAPDGGGSLIASGSATWSATFGAFYCELADTISLTAGSTYYIRSTIVDANGNRAVLEDSFVATKRTGRTPTT